MEAEAMSAYLKDRGIEAPHGSIYDEELRKRLSESGHKKLQETYGWDSVAKQLGELMARD